MSRAQSLHATGPDAPSGRSSLPAFPADLSRVSPTNPNTLCFDSPLGISHSMEYKKNSLVQVLNASITQTQKGVWVARDVWNSALKEIKEKAEYSSEMQRVLEKKENENTDVINHMQNVQNRLSLQLAEATAEIDRLNAELSVMGKRMETAESERASQTGFIQNLNSQLIDTTSQLQVAQAINTELKDRCRITEDKLAETAAALTGKNEEKVRLEHELMLSKKLNVKATDDLSQRVARISGLDRHIDDLTEENKELKARLGKLESVKLELEELQILYDNAKTDNSRLVKLAQTVGFAALVELYQPGQETSYIKVSDTLRDLNVLAETYDIADSREVVKESEGDYWMPTEAYTIAKKFHRRYAPFVSPMVFSQFLLKLNLIWRDHQTKVFRRMQQKLTRKFQAIQRKETSTVTYNVMPLIDKAKHTEKELNDLLKMPSIQRKFDSSEGSVVEACRTCIDKMRDVVLQVLDNNAKGCEMNSRLVEENTLLRLEECRRAQEKAEALMRLASTEKKFEENERSVLEDCRNAVRTIIQLVKRQSDESKRLSQSNSKILEENNEFRARLSIGPDANLGRIVDAPAVARAMSPARDSMRQSAGDTSAHRPASAPPTRPSQPQPSSNTAANNHTSSQASRPATADNATTRRGGGKGNSRGGGGTAGRVSARQIRAQQQHMKRTTPR